MRVALPQVKQTGVKKGGSMDDLISREKAIEAIDKVFPEDPNKSECASGVAIGAALASIYVKELPSADLSEYSDKLWRNAYERGKAEAQQRWIPCSERLPEEYGEYRITWVTSYAPSKRFIGDSEYEITSVWDEERKDFKGEWLLDDYIKHYPDVKVIAWKPFEEPYQEEGD
jgi:hypothetical protein